MDARGFFTRALVSDPSNQLLMEGLVLANVGAGDIGSAIPVARRMRLSGGTAQIGAIVLLADMLQREEFEQTLKDAGAGRMVGPLVDQLVAAWAELAQGRMSEALERFDALIASPGLAGFGGYHKALALALVGDFEGAEALLADPENGLVNIRRAVFAHATVLAQLDRRADALLRLEEAFGNFSDPEVDALRAALQSGGPVAFDTIRAPADGLAEVFHLLSVVLQGEAPDTQTLIYSRVAEYLRPDHVDAMLMSAGVLEALGQQELAIAAYDRVPGDHPARLSAATGQAQALFRMDRRDEAVATMQALAESHGQYLSVHVGLGDLLRRMERHAEAAEAYSRAVDLLIAPEPRHWSLFYSRAIAWERARQWDKAEPDFRRALELNPENPDVLNYLGYSLLDMNRQIPEALGMIERAVAQRPDNGYIIDSLGWGYFLTGRYDEALEQMERASLLMPVDPIVTDHLGDVYWAVGRQLEARFQWRRALSFEPEEKDATRIRRKLEIGLDAVLAEEGLIPLSERGK